MRRLGLVAQLVEQRIENPCVGGSIPPRATKNSAIPQFFTAAAASAEIFEKAWTGNQAIIKMLAALIG
jgi:hypothetical protein